MRRRARLLALCFRLGAAAAAPAAGERLSFVSCPIVRDTSTVPCWLAEYEGETYFLTLQTDVSAPVNPPWLGHQVLVEGVVSDEPGICGGRVLKPVTLSVMQELDGSCNTVLPAEERYKLAFEPPRPPGPSRGRLAFGDPRRTPRNADARLAHARLHAAVRIRRQGGVSSRADPATDTRVGARRAATEIADHRIPVGVASFEWHGDARTRERSTASAPNRSASCCRVRGSTA